MLIVLLPVPRLARADSISDRIAHMTLEERVGQLFIVRFWGTDANSSVQQVIDAMHPGGVVLLKENLGDVDQITGLTNGLQQLAVVNNGVPLLITLDQEGGKIQRLRAGFTDLPRSFLIGAITDEALLADYGAMMGRELRAVGVNMNLAPVLDLATMPNNPVMSGRMFGDDPAQVSRVTNAIFAGLDRAQVVSVGKHFPGHGEATDTHVDYSELDYDLNRLQATELYPFLHTEAAIIMLAHITVPALDPSGLPATLSPTMISYLRTHGYQGLVMTDAMDMGAIALHYDYNEAVIRAVEAGEDLILLGAHPDNRTQIGAYEAVLEAVRSGRLTEVRINQSVERILRLKQAYGLLEWSPLDAAQTVDRIAAAGGSALIPQLEAAAVTVARDTQKMLPLKQEKIGLITLAQYPQMSDLCINAAGHPLDSMKVNGSPVGYQISQAAALAKRVDALIVFTYDAEFTPQQQVLINTLPAEKTVVVALGSLYDWRTFPQITSYVTTYSDTTASIEAACQVVFGKREASGVLPVRLEK